MYAGALADGGNWTDYYIFLIYPMIVNIVSLSASTYSFFHLSFGVGYSAMQIDSNLPLKFGNF